MKYQLLSFLFFLPLIVVAQSPINKTKQQVIQQWKKNTDVAANCKTAVSETGDTLRARLGCAGATTYTQYNYIFDEKGKCKAMQVSSNSDSAAKAKLNAWLSNQSYHWQQVNENQYVSDFSSRLMIELPPVTSNFSFTVLRMEWTRELYDLLMKKE